MVPNPQKPLSRSFPDWLLSPGLEAVCNLTASLLGILPSELRSLGQKWSCAQGSHALREANAMLSVSCQPFPTLEEEAME